MLTWVYASFIVNLTSTDLDVCSTCVSGGTPVIIGFTSAHSSLVVFQPLFESSLGGFNDPVTSGLGLLSQAQHDGSKELNIATIGSEAIKLPSRSLHFGPMRAGDHNLSTVLWAIRQQPGTTRTTLARQTGLTRQTLANITSRLVELGLVHVVGRRLGVRGKPALQLEVSGNGAIGIGLNIDHDHLTLVALDLAGKIRSHVTRDIAFPEPADILAFVHGELDSLLVAGGLNRDWVLGFGVTMPDDVGRVGFSPLRLGYAEWSQAALVELLRAELPWPVQHENNAAAAVLAEVANRTRYESANCFYLLIGAGLGGAIAIDRGKHVGPRVESRNIGSMPVSGGGHKGAVVSDVVSRSELRIRLERQGHEVAHSGALTRLEGAAEEIVACWLDEAVGALVQPLIAIDCLLNPDVILIGGRLPEPLIARLVDGLLVALSGRGAPSHAKIKPATISQNAPAMGAAILPFVSQLLPPDAFFSRRNGDFRHGI